MTYYKLYPFSFLVHILLSCCEILLNRKYNLVSIKWKIEEFNLGALLLNASLTKHTRCVAMVIFWNTYHT
jgi:hypothetical protein